MNRVIMTLLIALVLFAGAGFFFNVGSPKAEDNSTNIAAKLQEIINNQQALSQKLDGIGNDLKEELRVIKMRVTK